MADFSQFLAEESDEEKLKRERKQRLQQIIDRAQKKPSAEAAEQLRLTQSLPLSPDTVERNPQEAKALDTTQSVLDAVDDAPATEQFLLDPDRASLAYDSAANLSFFEKIARFGWNGLARGGLRVQRTKQEAQGEAAIESVHDAQRSFSDILFDEFSDNLEPGSTEALPLPGAGETVDFVKAMGRYFRSRMNASGNTKVAKDYIARVEATKQRAANIKMSPSATVFRDAAVSAQEKHEDFVSQTAAVFKQVAEHPLGAFTFGMEVALESAPQIAVAAVVARVTRSPGAFATALGLGSGLTERYISVSDFVNKQGLDMSKPEDVETLLTDPVFLKKASKAGFDRGLIIGFIDGATGGLATKQFGNVMVNMGTQMLIQAAGGGGGEAIASAVTEGKVSPVDVLFEMLGEMATAPVDVVAAGYSKGRQLMGPADQVHAQKALLDRLDEVSRDTALTDMNPEMAADHRAQVAEETNAPSVFISVQDLLAWAKANKLGAVEAMRSLGVEDQMAAAVRADGDVEIDAETLARVVMGTDNYSKLAPHFKAVPSGVSAKQADAILADEDGTLSAALDAMNLNEEDRAEVDAELKSFTGEEIDAATVLNEVSLETRRILNIAVDLVNRLNTDTTSLQTQGRINELEAVSDALTREIVAVSETIEAQTKAGNSTKRSDRKLAKLIKQQQTAEDEVARLMDNLDAKVDPLADPVDPDAVAEDERLRTELEALVAEEADLLERTGGLPTAAAEVTEADESRPVTSREPSPDAILPGQPAREVGPIGGVLESAKAYMASILEPFISPREYVKADPERGARIAQAYEDMVHDPENIQVKQAYAALIEETLAMYQFIKELGVGIEFIPDGAPDPYKSPAAALRDLRNNNHIWVFPTSDGFGSNDAARDERSDHPMLQLTDEFIGGQQLLANDVFRIVHDFYGHAIHGNGFGANGEETAWQSHVLMYSAKAAQAMTTETRGQNSWVNFGPEGEANRSNPRETVYSDQKAGLMPEWTSAEGRVNNQLPVESDGRVRFTHYSINPEIGEVDPDFQGTNFDRRNQPSGTASVHVGFGVGRPGGYKREQGVGEHEFNGDVDGASLYDFDGDPQGLRVPESDPDKANLSYTEAIKGAGFKGFYASRSVGMQGELFEATPVKAASRDTGTDVQARRLAAVQERIGNVETEIEAVEKKAAKKPRPGQKAIRLKADKLRALDVKVSRATLRAMRQGLREGARAAKKDVKAAQTLLVKMIKKSGLNPSEQAKFLSQIKNMNSAEKFARQLPRIEARIANALERQRKAEVLAALKKVLLKTKQKGRVRGGRFTPAISKVLDRMRKAITLSKDDARAQLETRIGGMTGTTKPGATEPSLPNAGDALVNQVLTLIADPDGVSSTGVEDLLLSLNDIIAEGRSIAGANKLLEVAKQEELIERSLRIIGPEKQKKLTKLGRFKDKLITYLQDANAVGFFALSGSWWGKLQQIAVNGSAKEIETWIDDLSLFEETRTFERNKKRMIDRWTELVRARLGGISNIRLQRKLQHDATEDVVIGEFTHSDDVVRSIVLTRSQLRKRVMEMKNNKLREQALQPESHAYTPEILDAMEAQLTTDDRAIIAAQIEFYQEYYHRINAAYEKVYGVSLPKEDFYTPVKRVGGDETVDEFLLGALHLGGTVPGSLKSRQPSLRKLRDMSDIQTLNSHIIEMEYFIAYQEKVALLNAVFEGNNSAVMERIAKNHGKRMQQTMKKDLDYFSRRGLRVAETYERIITQLMSNFSIAQLAVKAQIMLKQLASFVAFAEQVPAADFSAGLIAFSSNPIAAMRTMKKSEYFAQRGINIDKDFQDMAEDGFGSRLFNFLGRHPRFTKVLMLNVRFGDKGAILIGGYAHVWAMMRNGATEAEALRSFERISSRTQQSADPDQLSELQRSSGLGRLLAQFLSSANALARAEYSAIIQFRRGRINSKEFAKRILIYHFIIPNLIMFIANGFEWESDDQLKASILGTFNGAFILGDLAEAVASVMTGTERFSGQGTRHVTSFMDDLIQAAIDYETEDITFADFLDGSRAIDKALRGVSGLLGIPFATLGNMLRGLIKAGEGDEEEGLFLMLGYSPFIIEKTGRD